MASEEHDRALQRLEAALVEQNRLGERFDGAIGTSTAFGAYVRLRAAADQVTAREAWVNWVDDEGYRGLNAGPFELLAEPRNSLLKRTGRLRTMTSTERQRTATPAARRRGEMNRADGDRRVGQTIKARRELATHRVGGRAWLNGREVGGADPRYMQLRVSPPTRGT
jgi:hypothetical protein